LFLRLAEAGGRLANLPNTLLLYRLRVGSDSLMKRAQAKEFEQKVVRAARIRRGLSVGPQVRTEKPSTYHDNGRGSWALWSHYASNGGYQTTAIRYAWRAVRSEPFELSSWKAMFRPYLRGRPKTRISR